MKRDIVELERDYFDANILIYVRFGLKKRVSFESIQSALSKLLIKHPLLRSTISDLAFLEKSHVDVALYLEKIASIGDDESLFAYTLDPLESLFKVIFSEESEKGTHFLFIVHHTIADAVSALSLVNDFVIWLFFPAIPAESLPLPLSIEEFYDHKPSHQESAEYASRLQEHVLAYDHIRSPTHHSEAPYERLIARMKSFHLQEKNVCALINSAKEEKISVNALITALFIKSLDIDGLICIGAAVDLRKRVKRDIPESLITAPVGAFIFLEVGAADHYTDLARRYQKKLLTHIASPELLLQHYAMIRGQLNPMELKASFFLSNAGQTSFSSEIKDKISYIYFSAKVIMNRPYITCLTHQKKMSLTATFPEPWISPSLVDHMVQSLKL